MPSIEDVTFEILFYEGVLAKVPRFVDALVALGDLYTKNEQYAKGLTIDLRLAALCPQDPIVLYNLSCSYSLTGHIDLAFETLKQAVEHGYSDFKHLASDDDLNNLRQDERFLRYMDELMKRTASTGQNPTA